MHGYPPNQKMVGALIEVTPNDFRKHYTFDLLEWQIQSQSNDQEKIELFIDQPSSIL